MNYYSYTQGNGPWQIWPARPFDAKTLKLAAFGTAYGALNPFDALEKVDWYKDHIEEATSRVDSDRLMQWDFDKHDACLMRVFGNENQYFHDREPEKIQEFLRLYFDNAEIKLHAIWQSNNVSNGYPVWHFWISHNS